MRKKLTLSLIITLIACMIFSFAAFAQTGGTDVSKTDNGEEVIYSLNLSPNSGIQAADFAISYKGENLEYVSYESGPLSYGDGVIMAANHVAEEQTIYVSYASLNPNEAGGTIMNLHFKKIADSDTPVVGIDVEGQYDGESNPIDNKVITGDASVASVASGKRISDADSGAQALTPSTENIPVTTTVDESTKQQGTAVDNQDASVDAAQGGEDSADTANGGNSSETSTQSGIMIAVVIVIVVVVIGVICAVIAKKKKADTQEAMPEDEPDDMKKADDSVDQSEEVSAEDEKEEN